MRFRQSRGTKGSQKWIQSIVDRNPTLLSDAIRSAFRMPADWDVQWVSPLVSDEWAEYRDADFLAILGVGRLAPSLEAFWPRNGPQWDALGKSSDHGVVLVEAKSHANELESSCEASGDSLRRIESSIGEAKSALGVSPSYDWLTQFYQYANRLAHLHFFQKHGVSARLAFVYFTNDPDMQGPKSASDWRGVLAKTYASLGFRNGQTIPGVCNVFVDVGVTPPVVTP